MFWLRLLISCLAISSVSCQSFFLYVWTGTSGKNDAKDFIATVDLVASSPKYGQIIKETYSDYGGSEAHHVGLVNNGTALAAGSYLDYALPGVPSVYLFNISQPDAPTYLGSASAKQSTVPDTFASLPSGGFIVSMMGSRNGGSPGRIARFNSNYELVAEYPTGRVKSRNSFNPHGIAVSAGYGVFVTADFYEPKSASVKSKRPVAYRSSVRLWNLTTFEQLEVFDVGSKKARGFMDVKFLGPKPVAVFGNGLGDLYALDVTSRRFAKVWSVPRKFLPTGSCATAPFKNGTRLIASAFESRALFLLNIEDPWNVILLDSFTLPKNAKPHAIVASPDGSLVAATSYFVDRPSISKIRLPGDKTLRFFSVVGDKIVSHPRLRTIDFKARYKSIGGASPHGMVLWAVSPASG